MRLVCGGALALLLAVLTACGSSESDPSPPSTTPFIEPATSAQAETTPACQLKTTRDVIVWMRQPDQPDIAQSLGDVNLVRCTYTVDDLDSIAPQSAGFCTKVAYADDNPGYDVDAEPAPVPRKVQAESGPAC